MNGTYVGSLFFDEEKEIEDIEIPKKKVKPSHYAEVEYFYTN